jgi:hypothetical protein
MPVEVVTPTELADAVAPIDARVTALENVPPDAPPYDDGPVLNTLVDHERRIATLEQRPPDTTAYNPHAIIEFDNGYFHGSNDEAKRNSMNAYFAGASGPTRVVVLDTRVHNVNGPIGLWSSRAKMVGTNGLPPREYGNGTVWNCTGPTVFQFVNNTGYNYPTPPAPRDMTFSGIEWHGGLSTDFIEPTLTYTSARTIWTSQWHNCGWVGFKSIWLGYADDVEFATGLCHFQAYGPGTMISLGGSECRIFDGGVQSVADSTQPSRLSSGSTFLESLLSKSDIGECMITSRGNTTGLKISGGHATTVRGLKLDAPDNAPTFGRQVTITGGQDHALVGLSLKGGMTNPGAATGGTAGNAGFIHVTGGRHTLIDGCAFTRRGSAVPPQTTPLVAATSTAGADAVLFSNGRFSDFSGRLQQANAGSIRSTDPRTSF